MRSMPTLFAAVLIAAVASPAVAGWKLMPAKQPVAVDSLKVTPENDWNQSSARPGKQGRTWTRDGFELNAIEFFAAIPSGQPIYRERDKKRNPMPKFDSGLLLPELADFFEKSFRAQNQLSDYTLIESSPATLNGAKGLRVRYRYTLPNDELTRLGEARLAVVKGKLYVANFYAPKLHYFDSHLPEANNIMDTLKF
jgi:hypothetical protein